MPTPAKSPRSIVNRQDCIPSSPPLTTKAPATGMDKISLDRNRNYARIVSVRDEAKRKRRNKEGYPAPTTFGASGILQSLFPDRSVPAFMVFLPNEPIFWMSKMICKLL